MKRQQVQEGSGDLRSSVESAFGTAGLITPLTVDAGGGGDTQQQRSVSLESQIASLKNALERKDSELEKAYDKLRKANTEVENAKRTSLLEKTQIKDTHDRELLTIKEKHLKQMSSSIYVSAQRDPPNKLVSFSVENIYYNNYIYLIFLILMDYKYIIQ